MQMNKYCYFKIKVSYLNINILAHSYPELYNFDDMVCKWNLKLCST